MSNGYAHPERLVETEWLAERLEDPAVIVVESNEDPLLYPSGHIPGAYEIDWVRDLNDPVRRDLLDRAACETLLGRIGWTPEKTLVIYGDRSNWWACYALWVFELFGVQNAVILNGGRFKWQEEGRPMVKGEPESVGEDVHLPERDDTTIRSLRDATLRHQQAGGQLIDVRSPQEFTGERMHMPDYPNEGALRGGHIPGAKNMPWAMAVDSGNGTFLPAERLREIYQNQAELKPDQGVVSYCRIGERSSHTWFVLRYLLGYQNVKNYDGSWTEWGNSVGLPIERP